VYPFIENCRVEFRHVASFDEELWSELLARFEALELDTSLATPPSQLPGFTFGPVLGDPDDPRVASLRIWKTHGEQALTAHFVVEARPSGEPPAEVAEIQGKLGGREGLFALAKIAFGREMPVAACSIEFRAPRSLYECQLLPSRLSQREAALIGDLGVTARREAMGFRFESGALGLTEFMLYYLHEDDDYLVNISANLALKLGKARWLPIADDVAEFVAQRLFESEEEGQ